MTNSHHFYPRVSAIIPTYNCVAYLPAALDSVLAQTYQDFEIVVVDDGSTDNTREVVAQYVQRFPGKIKYIFQENKGLAIARNTAIKNSSGEYIAILDADDMWLPDRLKEETALLDRKPEVGLVHANISWMGDDGHVISTPKRDKKFLSGFIFKNIFLRDAHISISTILLRKACFDRVGLFDENLARLGCEDRDMWLRVAKEYRFEYIDKVLGLYRVRQGSMSKNMQKMMEARYYVVDKFCPAGGPDQQLRRRALAKIHREWADHLLATRRYEEAKEQYRKALGLWPADIRAWINFLKVFLKVKTKPEV